MTTFTPSTPAEVLDALAWAAADEQPVEIRGHGSRRGVGRPVQAAHTLDLSELSGISLYEPAELVLSARAGTPLAEIERLLAENGQELAFEPLDCGPLFGQLAGRGTLGGVLASNASGPRRIKAGAARDHILGVSAVSGRGEAFKAGGRVVKNVTGFDLSKLMAGSWGTLAAVTDLTFKVLPRAETEATLALRGLTDEAAAAAMSLALGSPAEISGAAHLPETVPPRLGESWSSDAATLLRVEGFGPSVADRAKRLRDLLRNAGEIEDLDAETSRAAWKAVRDVLPFADGTERPVWRVSTAPSEGWKLVAVLRQGEGADAFYDWGGGLVWLRMEADPEAEAVRALTKHFGGHATLFRASPAHRAAVPVFEPQPPALAALSARLKAQFDPKNILNPGRMSA
ncbi:MAG TPA: glycolate oxidase subunit GlcE [Mesorhizobium sp.]|jgi:glycolate oxidase FAD binding subunit|nr:glycolate oxidase subunit GlcE [Mesorhizobium sp.]